MEEEMRMNIFFGNLFWGILLILWGASLILKTFNIHMPLAKIFLAVVIILFGIKLLLGDKISWFHSSGSYKRGSSYVRSNNSGEYTFVFSGGTIDLTDIKPNQNDLEITVVFGSAEVLLPDNVNFDIDPTSVFGSTSLPDRGKTKSMPGRTVRIESNAIFGRIEYTSKHIDTPPDRLAEEVKPGDF